VSAALTWPEAGIVGLFQGVAELFPVSSLGHSVLIPALIGGRWARDLNVSTPESPYLAFIVGLHVATALALVIYLRKDWVRIISGLVSSIRHRRVELPNERLAWLLVIATIPVGLSGLALEHLFRTHLGKPMYAASFLLVNGIILLAAERWVGSTSTHSDHTHDTASLDDSLSNQSVKQATLIGSSQILALAPGISRSGIALVAGLRAGLDHEQAARFSFLLATPVILAAGVLKLPDLAGPLGAGIRGQVLLGSVLSGIGAYVSVALLTKWFRVRSAKTFAYYCVAAGVASLLVLGLR
jgi:undecaprenyl-diphosphatase